ncbi:MAG: hypothetical protein JL56_01510 [Desulfotomaculum sp. BICA1-6]|nr:MAG: hypothetical protein JL56_01510 [Desulfotomaculum sp. BICA1-6]
MREKKEKFKNIKNGRLLKSFGSWMYCNACNKTVGYLCYTTYSYFRFDFICECGNQGYFELGEKGDIKSKENNDNLIIAKNRLCCPQDKSPLFSIVKKRLINYKYHVICKKCNGKYEGKEQS